MFGAQRKRAPALGAAVPPLHLLAHGMTFHYARLLASRRRPANARRSLKDNLPPHIRPPLSVRALLDSRADPDGKGLASSRELAPTSRQCGGFFAVRPPRTWVLGRPSLHTQLAAACNRACDKCTERKADQRCTAPPSLITVTPRSAQNCGVGTSSSSAPEDNGKPQRRTSPLHVAVEQAAATGLSEPVSLLLASGAAVSVKDQEGNTPLHLVRSTGDTTRLRDRTRNCAGKTVRHALRKPFSQNTPRFLLFLPFLCLPPTPLRLRRAAMRRCVSGSSPAGRICSPQTTPGARRCTWRPRRGRWCPAWC